MEIEDQVLSIEQVQELQELEFDIRKHSSMYYCPNWIEKFGVDEIQDYLLIIGSLYENGNEDCFPTMTTGDIINILPIEIYQYVLVMNKNYIAYDDGANTLFYAYRRRFIDSLFDCLVWCIKEKYIKL